MQRVIDVFAAWGVDAKHRQVAEVLPSQRVLRGNGPIFWRQAGQYLAGEIFVRNLVLEKNNLAEHET